MRALLVLAWISLGLPCWMGCGGGASVVKPTEEVLLRLHGEGTDRDAAQARLTPAPLFRDWGMKETAVDALARIGEAAVGPLIEALGDGSPQVRIQAARALGRLGPKAKTAVTPLIRALRDRNEGVRLAAARALGQIGPDAAEAIPVLIEALRE